MDHLDELLNRMGRKYRSVEYQNDIYSNVAYKINKKESRKNILKILALSLMTIFIVSGIFLYSSLGVKQFGTTLTILTYIIYSFAFMSLLTVVVMNSQKFLLKVFSPALMRKINQHNCYFSSNRKKV
ncbi:MAG TPA: hypothetical protein DHW82_08750 [Spirochaetia bacterium]|nr:MAG: hypothetical protein A2Y41_05105 [Spirochaetes bacterium GWB1_36_13]HCL57079.1 hypothetical protein [Spirochaetia bacterium]